MTDVYDYIEAWEQSDVGAEKLDEAHSYTLGDYDSEGPRFPRIEKFDALEPNRNVTFVGELPSDENPHPELTHRKPGCCGASLSYRRPERDDWKEWNKARRRALLGGRAAERTPASSFGHVAFPECPKVNAAIIRTALKFAPTDGNTPGEDFRDLCAHLAEAGVRRHEDGSYDVRFLNQEARAYLAAEHNPLSVNKYLHLKGTQSEK